MINVFWLKKHPAENKLEVNKVVLELSRTENNHEKQKDDMLGDNANMTEGKSGQRGSKLCPHQNKSLPTTAKCQLREMKTNQKNASAGHLPATMPPARTEINQNTQYHCPQLGHCQHCF